MRCYVRRVLEASLLPLAMLGASAVSAQQCPCTHFSVSANPPSVAIPRKILLLPLDVSVNRALGIHRMKQKDHAGARSYFERYLELAPDASDRAYVESYRLLAIRGAGK